MILLKKSFFTLVYIAISLLFVVIIQLGLIYGNWLPKDPSQFVSKEILFFTFIQAIVFVSFAIVFIKLAKIYYYKLGDTSSILKTLAEVIISFIGLIIVQNIAVGILSVFDVQPKQFESFNRDKLLNQPIYFFIAITLLAPFYEEFVFRSVIMGYLMRNKFHKVDLNEVEVVEIESEENLISLEEDTTFVVEKNEAERFEVDDILSKRNIKKAIFPILFSSFLFGAMHLDLDAFLPLFMMGIYLGAVTYYKRGIWLSVTLHFLQNILGGFAFVYQKELLEMANKLAK